MSRNTETRNVLRAGLLGTVLIGLVVLATLNVDSLPFLSSHSTYRALFTDSGGLHPGDVVEVAGVDCGSVRHVVIDHAAVAVEFDLGCGVRPGSDTTARIVTATVLGARHLRLQPAGRHTLRPGSTLGLDHTTSPYDLNDALTDLNDTAGNIDTAQLSKAMQVLAGTLQRTPDDLRAAVDGVGRLSATIAERDQQLRDLLEHAGRVTTVLAQRSGQLDTLVVDANSVLGELQSRRDAVSTLFGNVSKLAEQLRGLVHDNQAQLGPTLDKVDAVLAVLNKNNANISAAIARLGPYMTELGEAVASGPFFNSYIQNLIPGQLIAPYVDAALGPPAPAIPQGGR
ncbi:MCE family protein [Nocardia sp. CA2R105]|uniref:MCE family protein n=1 Tax=Nocardia coffeae TaxID=2873381 RepID=UPI001CA66E32|nr:MCE family protein [Nocardia coffeae]MBY8859376.1 MCE family protein [Nocardia coffeae]